MRKNFQKAKPKKDDKFFRANEQITSLEVFLIDENGEGQGKIKTADALARAKELEFDLVEVNPKANPPVVRIVDLGQLKYEREKKLHKQKVLQKKVDTKSVRLSLRIGDHDFNIRLGQVIKFLSRGDRVKIDIVLRGREKQHFDKAREIIFDFVNKIKQVESIKAEEEQVLTKTPGGFNIILLNKK